MAQTHLIESWQRSIAENEKSKAAVQAQIAQAQAAIRTAQDGIAAAESQEQMWTEKAVTAVSEWELRDGVPQWRRNAAQAANRQQELDGRIVALKAQIEQGRVNIEGIDSQIDYLTSLIAAEKQS